MFVRGPASSRTTSGISSKNSPPNGNSLQNRVSPARFWIHVTIERLLFRVTIKRLLYKLLQLYSSEPTQSDICVLQAFQDVVCLFTSHGGSILVGPARPRSFDCIFRYTITLSTVVLSTQTYLNFSEESLSSYKYFHSRGHAVGNQLGAKCNLFVSKRLFILSGTTAESLRKLEAWVISVPL